MLYATTQNIKAQDKKPTPEEIITIAQASLNTYENAFLENEKNDNNKNSFLMHGDTSLLQRLKSFLDETLKKYQEKKILFDKSNSWNLQWTIPVSSEEQIKWPAATPSKEKSYEIKIYSSKNIIECQGSSIHEWNPHVLPRKFNFILKLVKNETAQYNVKSIDITYSSDPKVGIPLHITDTVYSWGVISWEENNTWLVTGGNPWGFERVFKKTNEDKFEFSAWPRITKWLHMFSK